MGKERRERKASARRADAPRVLALLQAELEKVRRAQRKLQVKMDLLMEKAPKDAPCCPSCWLTACYPEYGDMAEKADRQAQEAQRLELRIPKVRALVAAGA